jgi:hypothetical protein
MLFEAGRVQERLPDFFDDAVNELLGVDGVEESALFLAGLRR